MTAKNELLMVIFAFKTNPNHNCFSTESCIIKRRKKEPVFTHFLDSTEKRKLH